MRNETGLVCDFCGKTVAEVDVLVVHGNAAICDDCVRVSLDAITEYRDHKTFWSKCHTLPRDDSTALPRNDSIMVSSLSPDR